MIIAGALDSTELDDLLIDHERLARNYRDSMTLRASIVAKLLVGQLPDDGSSIAHCEPVGL